MAWTRKNLTIDAERLRLLAKRRSVSESAAAREAIEDALRADEFVDLLRELHEAGYSAVNARAR